MENERLVTPIDESEGIDNVVIPVPIRPLSAAKIEQLNNARKKKKEKRQIYEILADKVEYLELAIEDMQKRVDAIKEKMEKHKEIEEPVIMQKQVKRGRFF